VPGAIPPVARVKEIDMADQTGMQQITPTLEEVVRRRTDLYQAILSLERAAARPAVRREDEWASAVIDALDEVAAEIVDHVEITERQDGLYDEIVEAAPRLSRNVQLLRAEHPQMQETVASLRALLQALPVEDDDDVAEVREGIQHVLGILVKHRQRGADLLWEAYNLDTGGAE
jgi:hypothetical protein